MVQHFFYDRDSEHGTLIELVKRRAFGNLVSELMDLMEKSFKEEVVRDLDRKNEVDVSDLKFMEK